jgi:outer membrane protein TolC
MTQCDETPRENKSERKNMKSYFKLLFILTVVLAVSSGMQNAAAQKITLSEAVDYAVKNNETVHQYEEKLKQKQYDNYTAWGNFLPSVTLSGSYNHMNAPLIMDLSSIRDALIEMSAVSQVQMAYLQKGVGLTAAQAMSQTAAMSSAEQALDAALPSFTDVMKKQDYREASFLGIQPIFLGGKLIAAKKYAASEVESAEIELKKTRNEVTQEAVSSYLAVVLMNDIVGTRRKVLRGMQQHQATAKRLLQEGLIAPHQELRAEVAVAEAERNLFDDENKRTLALIALKNTVGLPETEPIDVADSLVYYAIPDTLDIFLRQAQSTQPIFQLIAEKMTAAEQKHAIALSEFMPQVAVFGKYEIVPEDLCPTLEPRWIVGLQVSINIFDGFKKMANMESAAHLEREVEYIDADVHRKIELLINKNYFDMTNSRNRYFKLQSNLHLANENLRLMSERFQTGLGTSLDVVDASLILEKDEVENKNSLYEYYHSMTDLFTAIGTPEKIIEIWNAKEK